jgi:hypothetical protein
MRFFIGCTEICGLINIYAQELKKRGHQVTTCVNDKHRFFADHHYDIVSKYWADYLLGKKTDKPFGTSDGLVNKVAVKLRTRTPLFDGLISRKIYDTHDVFIFLWAGEYLMRNGKDLELLKKKGKKVISVLVGSDVRDAYAFQQAFNTDVSGWPDHYKKTYSYYNKILRQVELYSDLIFSVPDQSVTAIRAYHHFPIPLELCKYKFHWSDRDVPVVVHAPSTPALKGTDIVLATLERLKNEGLAFETKYIQNMKNSELKELLTNSDILIDELILNGPGILGVEAMLSGCAVATHYYEQSPECFRPPVCNVDRNNVYEVARKLITDKAYRRQLAFANRAYAEKHNDVAAVVTNILSKLSQQDLTFDYQPLFFRDEFIPAADTVLTNEDRQLNRIVAEKWMPDYDSHKQSLQQRGLI